MKLLPLALTLIVGILIGWYVFQKAEPTLDSKATRIEDVPKTSATVSNYSPGDVSEKQKEASPASPSLRGISEKLAYFESLDEQPS